MNRQLLEIDSKIERHARAILVLENKKRKLYQSSSSSQNEEVPLNFDDVGRTIRWNSGSIRLGKKPYLFVKTLWNAPRHRAEIDTLEKTVWQRTIKRNVKKITIKTKTGVREVKTKLDFIPKGTIFSTICRLQKELKSTGFPYKIRAVKIFSTQEIKGYALKRNGIAK